MSEKMSRVPPHVWLLILSACLLVLLSFGYRSGFGLYVKPLADANGWGRDTIGFALALQNLIWGVVAVFAGGLADRFGNIKVICVAALLYALGLGLTPHVTAPWMLNSTAGLLVGAGVAGTSFGIILPALARAVSPDRQQWVLGLGAAAGSAGQFLMVPVAQSLIESVGWVNTLHILALSTLAMCLLAMPLAPYAGSKAPDANDRSHKAQTMTEALREALGHRSYILLVLGFYVCGFHVAFITAHMPAYLSDLGFSGQVGAWAISVIGFCNIFGAYYAGVLSSKFQRKQVLLWIYLLRGVIIAVFVLTPITLYSVFIFCAAMGFLWLATVPPTSGLVSIMFGTRYMSLLYGVVFLCHQLGSFSGVWLGGWTYEQTGNYNLVWWLGVMFSLVAAALHWPIKEQPIARLAAVKPV